MFSEISILKVTSLSLNFTRIYRSGVVRHALTTRESTRGVGRPPAGRRPRPQTRALCRPPSQAQAAGARVQVGAVWEHAAHQEEAAGRSRGAGHRRGHTGMMCFAFCCVVLVNHKSIL
jgi:hypothetical protein